MQNTATHTTHTTHRLTTLSSLILFVQLAAHGCCCFGSFPAEAAEVVCFLLPVDEHSVAFTVSCWRLLAGSARSSTLRPLSESGLLPFISFIPPVGSRVKVVTPLTKHRYVLGHFMVSSLFSCSAYFLLLLQSPCGSLFSRSGS